MADYRIKRPPSDENLVMDVIAPAMDAWSKASKRGTEKQVLDTMTPGQRLMLAYFYYWDACTSGDHSSFFWNSSGNLWEYALEATHALGLPDYFILRDAVALFQAGRPSTNTAERRRWLEQVEADGKLDELDAKFEELDDRWAELSDRGDVLNDYIRRHPDDFFRVTTAR